MSERLNVLSIDWDYFIDATAGERSDLFPDGGNENFPYSLQDIIWSSHYATDEILKIKTDTSAIRKLKKVLKKQFGLMYMIMDSHKHAYDFIISACEEFGYDSLNLVNIDYHHDVYSNGDAVDCGNWLAKIIQYYKGTDSKFTWIARSDSDMDLGPSLDECEDTLECTEDLNIISEYQWDVVFICRSGMWSPPHLDKNFKDAFKWILDEQPARYQNDIFKDRYSNVRKIASDTKRVLDANRRR